jgi:hypothetical protein
MEIEIRTNRDILGDGENFRTIIDRGTKEKIFHLGEKNGETHIWINRMVSLDKVYSALNSLNNVPSPDTNAVRVENY